MRSVEKICRRHGTMARGFYRWLKRKTSKVWRRAAKLDPENAPVRRPTRGWCD